MQDLSRKDMARVGAAAIGGYLLGRTKKGKAGLSLALWIAGGGRYAPRNVIRNGVVAFARTPEASALIKQVRGSVVDAGRQAARSMVEARISGLTESLQQRTQAMAEAAAPQSREQQEQPAQEQAQDTQEQQPAQEQAQDKKEQQPAARAPQQREPEQAGQSEEVRA